jgi:NAD(P)-dependent dehydrogenase (short-subunit alcohol dehydrogenase family)
MPGELEGKVALVTGGSSGIGRETALAFAAKGARVVIAARGVAKGEETVASIRAAGGEAAFVPTDVSVAADVEVLIRRTVETYGRLDYAVNSAAIGPIMALTADCTEDDWDHVMGVNLKGIWLSMKYEIRQMLSQGGGSIVNFSSVAGMRSVPRLAIYCAAKAGIIHLTRTAAVEYAQQNIRINGICPGGVRTPLSERFVARMRELNQGKFNPHRVDHYAEPAELADAAVWLCAYAPPSVIGHVLVVDGGWTVQ